MHTPANDVDCGINGNEYAEKCELKKCSTKFIDATGALCEEHEPKDLRTCVTRFLLDQLQAKSVVRKRGANTIFTLYSEFLRLHKMSMCGTIESH